MSFLSARLAVGCVSGFRRCLTTTALLLATVFSASPAHAVVVLPTDLPPGAQYQIAFVTKGARDSFSGNISTYNNFVSQQASQNLDLPTTTWWAVASTGQSAQLNAKVYADIPVYNTAGQLVAANGTDFYSATHVSPIAYDQFGEYRFSQVWTGMNSDGSPAQYLDTFLPTTTYGITDRLDATWARGGASSNRMESRSLYAISEPLVAVPEPSTAALALAGLTCTAWIASRRSRGSRE